MRKFIGGNFYFNKLGFNKFFPCSNEISTETGHTLRGIIEFIGLPPTLHTYNYKNFKEELFKKLLQKFGIIPTYTEPYFPCQNRSGPTIGEVKRHARKTIFEFNTPISLWCFFYKYTDEVTLITGSDSL